jgi:hypothetical protein
MAYHFLYPLVTRYCAMYRQAVDVSSLTFSGGFGAWRHIAVSEEQKQAFGRPREAVVRSSVWLDLRSEPWWLTFGEIPPEVLLTVRWVDLWGFLIEEYSPAEHARRPGSVLLSAPVPVHGVPAEIDHIVSGESNFIALLTESRWQGPYALPGLSPFQPDITLEPVSAHLGRPAPRTGPDVDWWQCHDGFETTDDFWSCANFALSLVRPNQDDRSVHDRIAAIGLVAGRPWDASAFPAAVIDAIHEGMDDALSDLMEAAGGADTRHLCHYQREDMDRDYFGRALQTIYADREFRT